MVIELLQSPPAAPAPLIPTSEIRRAAKALRAQLAGISKYKAYYAGQQPLTYASEKFKDSFAKMVAGYRENLCPAVVDAMADRLIVTGVTIEAIDPSGAQEPAGGPPQPGGGQTPEEAAAAALWAIWRANRMDLRAGQIHKEASKCGNAYVIVWPDPITTAPRIYPQDPGGIWVHYDSETERIDYAVKFWTLEDKRVRVNVYYEDRIERYATTTAVRTGDGLPGDNTRYEPFTDPIDGLQTVPHEIGRVPVFHFANDADIGQMGTSDLRDVLPIQDALNKAVADMLVNMEFAAYPQRWATGLQVDIDPTTGKPRDTFVAGVNRMFTSADETTNFGQFEAANLEQMISSQNRFKNGIADVTGIPTHYLQMNPTSWPSGESLKTAEARFVAKITDRQVGFGNVWEDVLTTCAVLAGLTLPGQPSVQWRDASPRSDLDAATVAGLKKSVGVSEEQLQRELGYSEEEITRMAEERAAAADANAERQQRLLNAAAGEG